MSGLRFRELVLALGLLLAVPAPLPAQQGSEPGPTRATSVEDLVAQGRDLLDQRRPEEALPLLEAAERLDGASMRTRLWVLRAWMDLDRGNDTLDAIDALARGGETGPEIDYLYGMAFARRALKHLSQGVTDASIQMNFLDATEHLKRALSASPRRFSDGHLSLATAAWYTQDLETARGAAELATGYHREDGQAWRMLGRIAMSQFRVAHDQENWGPEAQAHWRIAHDAFLESVAVFGRPLESDRLQALLADSALQLGHARTWRQNLSRAADAYAIAIGWAPQAQDYGMLYNLLLLPVPESADEAEAAAMDRGAPFHRTLEEGARRFVETFGAEDARDASLQWWLGWSRYEREEFEASEAAFLDSVQKVPGYVNCWFWIALTRIARDDKPGATEAIVRGWKLDPSVLVSEMQSDLELNVWRLEQLIGEALERGALADCAILAELCAEAQVNEPRHWNNLGLFLRDEADRQVLAQQEGGPAPDPAELKDLYERSFAAYERSLLLDPTNAQLLNDTAVLLQYYLERDYDRALAMYEVARIGAERELEDTALSEEDRTFWETVLRDAKDNHRELLVKMEQTGQSEATRDLEQDPPR